jgi:hypothetical protein
MSDPKVAYASMMVQAQCSFRRRSPGLLEARIA